MRRPWHAGATTIEPDRRVSRPPAPAQAGADDLPVALGDEALAVAECLFPVGRPVRPAQFVGQRMRGREVGRGHRAQRDAVGNRCFDCTHRVFLPMNVWRLCWVQSRLDASRECGLAAQFDSMRCGGGSLCDNDAVRGDLNGHKCRGPRLAFGPNPRRRQRDASLRPRFIPDALRPLHRRPPRRGGAKRSRCIVRQTAGRMRRCRWPMPRPSTRPCAMPTRRTSEATGRAGRRASGLACCGAGPI